MHNHPHRVRRWLATALAGTLAALGLALVPTWTAVAGNGWDPADPSSGDGWENQALFDYAGRALPAMQWFHHR
jgi:arabinogalactan endo-1,4-beta-galactosidase